VICVGEYVEWQLLVRFILWSPQVLWTVFWEALYHLDNTSSFRAGNRGFAEHSAILTPERESLSSVSAGVGTA
jgi:hypothetical protein